MDRDGSHEGSEAGPATPNAELADQLAELAALLRVRKGDRFRIRAYERGAQVVRATPVDLAAMEESEVRRLTGIGPAIAGLIAEHNRTGGIALLEELRGEEPPGFGALLGLPLLGVRDARTLAGTHGFGDVAALQAAADSPRGLEDLGERLAGRVRESLRRLDSATDQRLPLPLACRDADALAGALADLPGVDEVAVAGSVRRGADTVGAFDLVVVTARPGEVGDAAAASRAVVRVLERDQTGMTVLSVGGRRTRLWLADPEAAGAALLVATGSAAHLAELHARAAARGAELRADGLWAANRRAGAGPGGHEGVDASGPRVAGRTEEEVYRALGLPVVPPELREAAGELAAAEAGALPRLVEVGDLRGDLHVHTDWSRDGRDSLERMVQAAAARGHAYVALTDHAENLTINGMSREAVLARRDAIAALQERFAAVRLLDAAELNIGLDGSLDYDLDFLGRFDLGVASVHSHMDRPSAQQTERILAAVAHPAVHVIGHPTGRILGRRPGYRIELEAIAQAAAETGTALEVNGSPRRLDLSGDMVRAALAAGATLALSSDAHSAAELDYLLNAVPTARRGWATPADVLNCHSLPDFLARIAH